MSFFLMTLQAGANHLHQADIQQRRHRKVPIKASLPAQRFGGHRVRTKLRQTEFFESDAREIQRLRPAVIGFSIHTVLVVAPGIILDALFGLRQQDSPRTKGADRKARRERYTAGVPPLSVSPYTRSW